MWLKLLEWALWEYNRVNSDKVIAFRTRLYENFHNTTIFEQLWWEVKFWGNLHTRTTRIIRDGFHTILS